MADPTEREPPKKKAKAKASSASSEVFTTHTPGFVPYDDAMRKPDDAVGGKKVGIDLDRRALALRAP
jgi:hypothetical protein